MHNRIVVSLKSPMFKNLKEKIKIIKRKLLPLKWAIAIILFLLIAPSGLINWGGIIINQGKYITVTGTSKSANKNEISKFTVNVSHKDPSKSVVVEKVYAKAQVIVDGAKNFGIPTDDIKTSNVNVFQNEEPVTINGVQTYRKTDWRANITIEIILRNISRAGDLSTLLSSKDIDSLYGPEFTIDQSKIDETRLLQAALIDASEKAKFVARSAHMRLGGIINIVEGTSNSAYPQSLYGGKGGGADVNYEPGTTEVTKTVTITFKLY
jgi:uncharacterized protein YggE